MSINMPDSQRTCPVYSCQMLFPGDVSDLLAKLIGLVCVHLNANQSLYMRTWDFRRPVSTWMLGRQLAITLVREY